MPAGYKLGVRTIKALMADGTWLLGFSELNLERFRQGKAVSIDFKELGMPANKVVIFTAATEEALALQLAPYLKPDTRIHGDEH